MRGSHEAFLRLIAANPHAKRNGRVVTTPPATLRGSSNYSLSGLASLGFLLKHIWDVNFHIFEHNLKWGDIPNQLDGECSLQIVWHTPRVRAYAASPILQRALVDGLARCVDNCEFRRRRAPTVGQFDVSRIDRSIAVLALQCHIQSYIFFALGRRSVGRNTD